MDSFTRAKEKVAVVLDLRPSREQSRRGPEEPGTSTASLANADPRHGTVDKTMLSPAAVPTRHFPLAALYLSCEEYGVGCDVAVKGRRKGEPRVVKSASSSPCSRPRVRPP
jgi:hypothetical protein